MTKEKSVASTSPSQTSVDRIIKETWGEILEKENQNGFPLGVGLSLPDLSVTPISTVNESTNQMPSSILRGIPSESGMGWQSGIPGSHILDFVKMNPRFSKSIINPNPRSPNKNSYFIFWDFQDFFLDLHKKQIPDSENKYEIPIPNPIF